MQPVPPADAAESTQSHHQRSAEQLVVFRLPRCQHTAKVNGCYERATKELLTCGVVASTQEKPKKAANDTNVPNSRRATGERRLCSLVGGRAHDHSNAPTENHQRALWQSTLAKSDHCDRNDCNLAPLPPQSRHRPITGRRQRWSERNNLEPNDPVDRSGNTRWRTSPPHQRSPNVEENFFLLFWFFFFFFFFFFHA